MNLPKYTVCVIDDDAIYQFTAHRILTSTGLTKQVRSFHDGSEALAYFNEAGNRTIEALPDMVLLDINMPIMDGWAFLNAYREIVHLIPKKIPIYMVSSSVDEADIQRAEAYQLVSGYLIKPVTRSKYQELLEQL